MGINLLTKGYNNVQVAFAGEFTPLPPGGYICRVCNSFLSKSKSGNDMLVLFLDIAEGNLSGYFKAATDRVKNLDSSKQWDNSAIYRQLLYQIDGNISPFFKGLLNIFQQSNPNLNLNLANFDPQILRDSIIGFIFAQEQYRKNNGCIGTRTFIKFPKSIDDIHTGNFHIPQLKRLPIVNSPDYDFQDSTPIEPDDIPF